MPFAYEKKFGHRCIVFAAGKSALQILDAIQRRLLASAEQEMERCAEQTAQITSLRLARLFVSVDDAQLQTVSPITTHILDTSRGCPAQNVQVQLYLWSTAAKKWYPCGSGVTNSDGRVTDLLPGFYDATGIFTAGTYRIIFHIADYFERTGSGCFYPSVSIDFTVVDPTEHYHVPLLLNPFGFSTYRGS